MRSLRRHEGYLLHDERASGGVLSERPTYTCSHCPSVVVMNPLRTRAREYCPHCDHFICDACGAIRKSNGGACRSFKRQLDALHERTIQGR